MTYIKSNAYFLSDTDNDNVVVLAPKYIKVGDEFEHDDEKYTITKHREGPFFEIDRKITCNMGEMIEVTHKKRKKYKK